MAELRPDIALHSEDTVTSDHQLLPQPQPVEDVLDTEGKGEEGTEDETRSAPEKLGVAEDVVLLR